MYIVYTATAVLSILSVYTLTSTQAVVGEDNLCLLLSLSERIAEYRHRGERLVMSVYTANYVEDKQRREAVVEMMRAGDWRGVIHSFHGGEEARWAHGISLFTI